jgi:hypothetical protein
MDLNSPKSEPEKSYEKRNTEKVEKDEIVSKPDDTLKKSKTDYKDKKIEGASQKPKDKPKNKIEPRKIDIQKETRHKIQRQKSNPLTPTRNKIEPRRIDIQKEPKHKIQHQKSNHLTPPRNKIERSTIDLTREPKNKINLPKLESKDMQNLDINTIQNIKIKEEIKNVDWKNISENWSITTRSNQYAEYRKVSLDPTKEVSKENPLYRHKEWLNKIYNSKNWKLNDKDIANLCGVDPSVIGKWRKKHQISRKLQGEGRWTDKRSGRVYIRVPQDYNHPELTKTSGSVYRLEHIYNIEKYLSRHPELELSKKYLIDGKYLKIGTKVNYIDPDSKDNSIGNLKIIKSTVKPIKKKEILRNEKILNRPTSKNSINSSQKPSKNNQAERSINKRVSKKVHAKGYRARVTMPKDYKHPELNANPDNRYIRQVHTANMEKYLANNPNFELSKKYLIQGKYLRTGTEVHHINQIKTDNRVENLWIYENRKEHARGELTLYDSLKTLISSNQVLFKNGKYFINPDLASLRSNLNLEQEKEVQINYKNINLVKEEIKKINWNSISNEWSVQVKKNQFVQKTVIVDPTRDCSEENPLHHHKEWLRCIVSDNRFNLTDSRLAKLCGFSRDTARYWRERVHGIQGKTDWGYKRRVDESDGRIWIKVPKAYANPVVQKDDHHRRIMLEHRYIIEQHLAKCPELEISKKCLIDGKYLKTEAHVHHINLNYQDNRTENLWVFENVKEHNLTTKSLYSLLEELLNSGKIRFKEGKYHTDA